MILVIFIKAVAELGVIPYAHLFLFLDYLATSTTALASSPPSPSGSLVFTGITESINVVVFLVTFCKQFHKKEFIFI